MILRVSCRLVATLFVLTCASCAPRVARHEYVIGPDALRQRLEAFSDDSMVGRSALGPGHDKGTAYLAREAARAGLEPAGDNGGWFQAVHIYARRISPASRLIVGDSSLLPIRDFKTFASGGGQPRVIEGKRAIYGGVVGQEATQISADAAASRVVVLSVPPDMNPSRVYSNVSYGAQSRFGQAAAVVIASFDFLSPGQRATSTATGPLDPTEDRADAHPISILVTERIASAMLGQDIRAAKAGALGRTIGGRIIVEDRDVPTQNVIAVLRGSDSSLSRTYVALGAHSDHLGISRVVLDHDSVRAAAMARQRAPDAMTDSLMRWVRDSLAALNRPRRDSIYNGADDNGSGTVALLEAAKALATGPRPLRSVLFVWHAAEEDGYIGSRWFVDHPTVPLDSIVAHINLDMVGRGGAKDINGGGSHFLQVLGSTRRSTNLWPLIAKVNADNGSPFAIDTVDTEGVYCRSDHWNYARYGIPIAFMTTGGHVDYHSVTDEARYVDYRKLAAVSRFTVDIVRALANRRTRLDIVGPAPDPRGYCHG